MLAIRKGGHTDLNKFYSLFEIDFDSEELLSKLSLHKGLMNGSVELLIVYDDESQIEIAYALVLVKSLYNCVLLKYFGVLPWYRGRGMGVEAMRLIAKRYADRQAIIAEITEFDDPEPDHVKKLRRFFSRFGFVEVERDYTVGGAAAHIYARQLKGSWELAPVAHRVIPDMYSRFLTNAELRGMIEFR